MSNTGDTDSVYLLGLTRDIVSAYLANHSVSVEDLPNVISDVYTALLTAPATKLEPEDKEAPIPAVEIKLSVTEEHIICLEDGLPFKSLKRHIRSKYNMTPEAYREKWGLASDYPMVAPGYAKERSRIAKQSGLGRKPNQN